MLFSIASAWKSRFFTCLSQCHRLTTTYIFIFVLLSERDFLNLCNDFCHVLMKKSVGEWRYYFHSWCMLHERLAAVFCYSVWSEFPIPWVVSAIDRIQPRWWIAKADHTKGWILRKNESCGGINTEQGVSNKTAIFYQKKKTEIGFFFIIYFSYNI